MKFIVSNERREKLVVSLTFVEELNKEEFFTLSNLLRRSCAV
jgi:hypothetical protein